MGTDMHDQPTEPWHGNDITDKRVRKAGGATAPMPAPSGTTVPMLAPMTAPMPAPGGVQHSMSRRKLFGIAAAGAAALTAGGFALSSELQRGTWNPLTPSATNVQIGHLLRRAGFGATPQEISSYAAPGFTGAVDHLLNYQQVSDDAMESRLNALNLDFNKPQNQQQWWLMRMAWTQRPLLEKMTLFWHGVLTSSFRKVGGRTALVRMITQNNFLRAHALDTFDNIMLGITADPAMLVYLDLTRSTKAAPNENYAREMMELFTLGLGHYTQQDVYEGAAALTGWHVIGQTTQSHYLPYSHNDLTKTYLGHTGNLDYKDVINILVNHPATPWFISRKLFTFFVYENPSNEDLSPLVDTYVKSGHNIGAVMRTLLLSPQFSSAKAYRSRVKSPAEFVVGAYRALNVQGNGKSLPAVTTLMGQPLFDPPNVAGWPGDKVSALWLNSGTWMTRLNYIDLLLSIRNPSNPTYAPIDLQSIVNANHIDTPEHFVDYFASFLLDGQLTADRHSQLVAYFNEPESAMFMQQITLTNGKSYPINRVRGTLYLLMASPEYQLN